MVDRLSSKVDEEVSGSVKGNRVLMVLPQKSHFNLILYFASINASQSHEHFPIARVCGEREDQRRGHHCALQGGFNIIIIIIIESWCSNVFLETVDVLHFVFSGRDQWPDFKEGGVDAGRLRSTPNLGEFPKNILISFMCSNIDKDFH